MSDKKYRDAGTGEYVTKEYADEHPETTVAETSVSPPGRSGVTREDQPRPRKRHELKCWPEFFEPTLRGIKRFELRRDDRGGFQVGDELLLKEWNPEIQTVAAIDDGDRGTAIFPCMPQPYGYTGREVLVRVDYVMPVEIVDKLMDLEIPYPVEHVIMSISRVE